MNSVNELRGFRLALDSGLNHREFVAAETGGDIRLLETAAQAIRHAHQKLVADGMTERIVDALELVDVDIEHGELLARPHCLHRLFEPFAQPRTGESFAVSGDATGSYERLTRTVAVPAGGAELSFWTTRRSEEGFDVLTVDTGADARATVGRSAVDVVVMDRGLPDMDGLEATASLREDGFVGAVVVISGHAGPEHVAACLPVSVAGPVRLARAAVEVAATQLGGMREDVARDVLHDLLAMAPPERERLLETVDAFAATGSVVATAQRTFCHRNTVLNQLRRVTECTGLDLAVPEQATVLLLGLAAWRQHELRSS